jgi:hypothetical protein
MYYNYISRSYQRINVISDDVQALRGSENKMKKTG